MTMKVEPTRIPDVLLITPQVFGDHRGYFMEIYNKEVFAPYGIDVEFVQDNMSSSTRGTLRGLHYQLGPYAQGKLVRVVSGTVFDVAVDLRRSSPTFGQWVGAELSAENRQALYIPPGFAHGFYVLSDIAEFMYKCTGLYAPQAERGIIWNDPTVNVSWPLLDQNIIISDKDRNLPVLQEAEYNFE